MTTPDKCPYCGAKFECSVDDMDTFECTTFGEFQSDLCRERSDHAETRKDLEEANAKYFAQSQRIEHLVEYKEENMLLRARVAELEGLELLGRYRFDDPPHDSKWVAEILMPADVVPDIFYHKTLGQAMPRKEGA